MRVIKPITDKLRFRMRSCLSVVLQKLGPRLTDSKAHTVVGTCAFCCLEVTNIRKS